ncbi:hypothetical protein M0805_001172 [Coniferiporia weirii]|nr:hypothetical protein M0805_001172 [Coniferiporia weirii]
MPDSQIYTALSVPTPGPQPSIACAQWSDDGQLILSTKSAIFILTPDLGINFDNLSLLKTDRRNFPDNNSNGNKDAGLDLGWHRNLIELEKIITHQWPLDTQEWGAVALGSLDVSWRAVTISPGNLSNLSTGSGCLLVVMSTNLELTLWCATKNHLKEAWTKIQDITSTLKELPSPRSEGVPQDQIAYLKTLQAQVNCMAWSQQADFNIQPNPLVDGSLLVLGNRAGSIILMRHDGVRSMRCDLVVRIADEWITHLAWGPWRAIRPFHTEAYLACGVADGSIVIVRINQWLEPVSSTTPFGPTFSIRADANVLHMRASDADGKGITALSWVDRIEIPHEKPTLFHAKPGLFRFFQLQPTESNSTAQADTVANLQIRGIELAALKVQTQKTSIGSSSLLPVSGIIRLAGSDRDIALITLFDGSFHIVRDICTTPAYDLAGGGSVHSNDRTLPLSSALLSRNARAVFTKTEGGKVQWTDVGRTSGAVGFDGISTFLWLHESSQPTDFSYKHDAKHNSMLVLARLWNDPLSNENLLKQIREVFERPRSVLGRASAHVLRPVLLHLCQRAVFDTVWPHVLELLPTDLQETESAIVIEPLTSQLDDEVRRAFRRSLSIDLFGWDSFTSRRLRLAVADYCWKMSSTDDMRQCFGNVAQGLLNGISHRFMKVVVKHLAAVINSLTEKDLPFLMRIIVQSLLEGSPPDLTAQAHALNEAAKAKFHSAAPDAFGLIEPCPACHTPIALENLLNAVCPLGHVWARCSITSFVLATPLVRTCVGCTRKAFLAPSSHMRGPEAGGNVLPGVASGVREDPLTTSASVTALSAAMFMPEAGRSWVVDELLEAVRCCLYCGNRFVRIL